MAKHVGLGPLLEVHMSKEMARLCGAKHIPKPRCENYPVRAIYGGPEVVQMSAKMHPVVARSTFPSQKR